MKKTYVKPVAEKIQFDYSNQVVAASAGERSDWFAYNGGQANYQESGCKCYVLIGCDHAVLP